MATPMETNIQKTAIAVRSHFLAADGITARRVVTARCAFDRGHPRARAQSGVQNATGQFAKLADILLQAHVADRPSATPRSLRDVVYERRSQLSGPDHRCLTQLQSAALLTRHVAMREIEQRVDKIARSVADACKVCFADVCA